MAGSPGCGPFAVAEGFYLAHIVYHLHRAGLLDGLGAGRTPAELAAEHGSDEPLLRSLLEYVRQRSDIVVRDESGVYALNAEYQPYHRFGFHLDKFIGAYGLAFRRLGESLASPALGLEFVDDRMLSEAFHRAGSASVATEAAIVRAWQIRSLIDLGCGPGTLLCDLALGNPGFRGWGVDASPRMLALAVERARAAGVEHALRFVCGDARDLSDHLTGDDLRSVEGLHCRSLFNELFRDGPGEAVKLVAQLAELFAGRLLLVGDYYGRLGFDEDVPATHAHTLLQDVAQAVSGQGIPPPDLDGWAEIYRAGGAQLLHGYEGDHAGIVTFVHVVRL